MFVVALPRNIGVNLVGLELKGKVAFGQEVYQGRFRFEALLSIVLVEMARTLRSREVEWLIGSGHVPTGEKIEIVWDKRTDSLAELFLLHLEDLLPVEGAKRLLQTIQKQGKPLDVFDVA